ncbi:NAD(P)-binding oxidoreductase [Paenibacillus polymyxa]|uniref:NAD(P)-binding oxidoreductase n=1 Tax=Paenibacillus polymyxa TaxID=1406 RepID=UPI0032AF21FF
MAKAIADTDVVISCIGPTSNFSPGTVMSEGIPNILAASQRAGVKRLVMQSGIGLSNGKELSAVNRWAIRIHRRIFSKTIKDKANAGRKMQRSDLDWVIVRPDFVTWLSL